MAQRRLRLYGRVQGVCFRDWAVSAARPLGLRGWVRNRLDGSVEILVAGEAAAVATFAASCRHGPAGARVDRVDEGGEADAASARVLPAFTRRPMV